MKIKTETGIIELWTNEGEYWTYKITNPDTKEVIHSEYYYNHETKEEAIAEAMEILEKGIGKVITTCSTCSHFFPDNPDKKSPQFGQCKRYPPTEKIYDNDSSDDQRTHISVHPNNTCGEHKPKGD